MVRKHLPNVMATAKGHLDRTPSGIPHAQSEAVSARKRHHAMKTRDAAARLVQKSELTISNTFDPTTCPRSKILHLDYTGPLPDVCSSGTRYFQVSCYGGYINIQPLRSLRQEHHGCPEGHCRVLQASWRRDYRDPHGQPTEQHLAPHGQNAKGHMGPSHPLR
jgi:hypothetical protein